MLGTRIGRPTWCRHYYRYPVYLVVILAFAAGALVFGQAQQTAQEPFKPEVGQAGKDVVWVPSPQSTVEAMLNLAKVTPQDYLMDLGSGDGRTVITAAKRGAQALGVEFNPNMVDLSKKNAVSAGVNGKATFVQGDLFLQDLSKATVITMFLLPDINLKLRPKILDLKPGTRIVSNTFEMGEWKADETSTVKDDCTSWCTALLWIVPAKVEGTWRLGQGTLTLKQDFQMVSGMLTSGSTNTPVTNGRLRGDQITFTAGGSLYSGRVNGNAMDGDLSGQTRGKWSATRAGR